MNQIADQDRASVIAAASVKRAAAGENTSSAGVSGVNPTLTVEKPKQCPEWSDKMKYETYKKHINNWCDKNPRKDAASKYTDILESLKKNNHIKDLRSYVSTVVCEKMKDVIDPKPTDLFVILDNKYKLSQYEKISNVIKGVQDFKGVTEKDQEKYFEKVKD